MYRVCCVLCVLCVVCIVHCVLCVCQCVVCVWCVWGDVWVWVWVCYSCLRCKHAACDVRSCSKCTSHNVETSPVDDRATGFTKSAKWHDCDKAALLLWHHMLECPGTSSSEEAIISSRLEQTDADGKAELRLVRRELVNTSRSAAATKGSWAETQEMGPWCDMDQTKHAKLSQ